VECKTPAVLLGEVQVRQHVLGRIGEQIGGLGEPLGQDASHLLELPHGACMVRLRKHRSDEGSDRLLRRLGYGGQDVLGLPALTAGSPQGGVKIR
jgi:hypothetical protein